MDIRSFFGAGRKSTTDSKSGIVKTAGFYSYLYELINHEFIVIIFVRGFVDEK
jgi:hypothetical protein